MDAYGLWLLLGLIAGAAFVAFARSGGPGRERAIYANGLLIAAAVYPVFAMIWGDGIWLTVEMAGLVGFGILAWIGRYRSSPFLAVGWLLHPLWDVGLHLWGPGAHIAPTWYAIACVSFDVLLAAVILQRLAILRRPQGLPA